MLKFNDNARRIQAAVSSRSTGFAMKPRFKVGDLVIVVPGRSFCKDVYDPILLLRFHPAKVWSKANPCPASELKDYWSILVGEEHQMREADYVNDCCEKLA